MNKYRICLLLVLWLGLAAVAYGQKTTVHVVRQGETLLRIARQYGISVEELRRLNNLKGDVIRPGQRLIVAVQEEKAPETYVVKEGETLYTIAFRYGLSVDTLLALNPLQSVFLEPGQTLKLPPSPTVRGYTEYRVRSGDTLYRIATRFGTSVQAIRRANGLRSNTIRVGQRLRIPVREQLQPREQLSEAPPDTVGPVVMYPPTFAGRLTASGEPYDPDDFTASHPTLPFGTLVILTAPRTGRSVFVRVNDRGPWEPGLLMEISEAAAQVLGMRPGEREPVEIRIVGRPPAL